MPLKEKTPAETGTPGGVAAPPGPKKGHMIIEVYHAFT
jgi:hypothetical protein